MISCCERYRQVKVLDYIERLNSVILVLWPYKYTNRGNILAFKWFLFHQNRSFGSNVMTFFCCEQNNFFCFFIVF